MSERSGNALVAGGIGAAVLLAGMLAASPFLAHHIGRSQSLSAENDSLRTQLGRVSQLESALLDLERTNNKMRAMLGIEPVLPGPGAFRNGIADTSSAAAYAPPSAVGVWRFSLPTRPPVMGMISRGYRQDAGAGSVHPGVDIPGALGVPIVAAGGGIVLEAKDDPVYGNMLVVTHGQDLQTVYGHASRLLVAAGDSVRAGQTIALVGSSGRSSAPHLHFEVRESGRAVDPSLYVREYAAR